MSTVLLFHVILFSCLSDSGVSCFTLAVLISTASSGAEDFYMQKTWNPNPSTTCSTANSSTATTSSSSDSFSRNSVKYLERVKKKLAVKMDLVFETCLAQDTDFPVCDSPVWVFGRSYSIHYGKDRDGKGQFCYYVVHNNTHITNQSFLVLQ